MNRGWQTGLPAVLYNIDVAACFIFVQLRLSAEEANIKGNGRLRAV